MKWNDIVSIVTALIAVATVYIAWRKLKPEYQGLDADAATKYAELVDRAAKRETEYQNRIDEIRRSIQVIKDDSDSKVAALEKCQEELEGRIGTLERENRSLKDWASRLVHQVKSLGAIPVEINT